MESLLFVVNGSHYNFRHATRNSTQFANTVCVIHGEKLNRCELSITFFCRVGNSTSDDVVVTFLLTTAVASCMQLLRKVRIPLLCLDRPKKIKIPANLQKEQRKYHGS